MIGIVKSVASESRAGRRNAVVVDKVFDVVVEQSAPDGQRFKILNDADFIFPRRFSFQRWIVFVGAPRPPVVISWAGQTV
jgi:hypothetical protein